MSRQAPHVDGETRTMFRPRDPNVPVTPAQSVTVAGGKPSQLCTGDVVRSPADMSGDASSSASLQTPHSPTNAAVTAEKANSPSPQTSRAHAHSKVPPTPLGMPPMAPSVSPNTRPVLRPDDESGFPPSDNARSPLAAMLAQYKGAPRELHVVECDPEPDSPTATTGPAAGAPVTSFSLRRATRTAPASATTTTTNKERSPSPEPTIPSPFRVPHSQASGEPPVDVSVSRSNESSFDADIIVEEVQCVPSEGEFADTDAEALVASLSGIALDSPTVANPSRGRSLERDFVPDHLLNNEDFIDRLVSEVRYSFGDLPPSPRNAYPVSEGDTEEDAAEGGFESYDPEVAACLRLGARQGPALSRPTREPIKQASAVTSRRLAPPKGVEQSRRSRSPARSRSPSPCATNAALADSTTRKLSSQRGGGGFWSPSNKGDVDGGSGVDRQPPHSLMGTKSSPRLSGPGRTMHLGAHLRSVAPPQASAPPPTTSANLVYDVDVQSTARAPSSVPVVNLSRDSSPDPHAPSPAPEGDALLSAGSQSPADYRHHTRREGGVSPDRAARSRSPSLSPRGTSLGRPPRPQHSHPSWAPRPVTQHRPAWGQRVPPNPKTGRDAVSPRSLSPSPRAPSMRGSPPAQQPQRERSPARSPEVASEDSRRRSRTRAASSQACATDAAQGEPAVTHTAAAAVPPPAAVPTAGEVVEVPGAVEGQTQPRESAGSVASSSATYAHPPFARVLFGSDGGSSPLSQTDSGGSPDVTVAAVAAGFLGVGLGVGAEGKDALSASPLLLHGVVETAQAALARAAKAESRCAELERELRQARAEQAEERDAFATRLAQLSGQMAFTLRWIQSFDPTSVPTLDPASRKEAFPTPTDGGNTKEEHSAPLVPGGASRTSDTVTEMASHMTQEERDDAEANSDSNASVHSKHLDSFRTEPRRSVAGTPAAQGVTPTPCMRGAASSCGRDGSTATMTTGGGLTLSNGPTTDDSVLGKMKDHEAFFHAEGAAVNASPLHKTGAKTANSISVLRPPPSPPLVLRMQAHE